eukprot:CAMPEP_0198207102 /NCGR_PEP_ID=MMETSP1445-20131203/10580_1 /TAXON_ID=36898 /ORGANISM="Pyramimonas sp., Strain CCMP2087" /LENGTH=207 /DNA_ID=CAMNT_0043880011 /DNA_START=425 /DNA_END=1048 /DNA_ORIENTATION=+
MRASCIVRQGMTYAIFNIDVDVFADLFRHSTLLDGGAKVPSGINKRVVETAALREEVHRVRAAPEAPGQQAVVGVRSKEALRTERARIVGPRAQQLPQHKLTPDGKFLRQVRERFMACTFGRLLTAFVGQGGARAVATDLVRTAITIVSTLGQRRVAEIQPGSQPAFHVHRIRRRTSTGEKLLVFAENPGYAHCGADDVKHHGACAV